MCVTQKLSNRGGEIPNFLEQFISESLGRDMEIALANEFFLNTELTKFKLA